MRGICVVVISRSIEIWGFYFNSLLLSLSLLYLLSIPPHNLCIFRRRDNLSFVFIEFPKEFRDGILLHAVDEAVVAGGVCWGCCWGCEDDGCGRPATGGIHALVFLP